MLNVCIICRVCKFIRYLEAKKKEEKIADTSLSEEQIRMLASEWGAADIKDILAMRGKMALGTFRDWVTALGYLQVLQNALARGNFAKGGSLWQHCIIIR